MAQHQHSSSTSASPHTHQHSPHINTASSPHAHYTSHSPHGIVVATSATSAFSPVHNSNTSPSVSYRPAQYVHPVYNTQTQQLSSSPHHSYQPQPQPQPQHQPQYAMSSSSSSARHSQQQPTGAVAARYVQSSASAYSRDSQSTHYHPQQQPTPATSVLSYHPNTTASSPLSSYPPPSLSPHHHPNNQFSYYPPAQQRPPFPTQQYQKIRTIRKTLFGKVVLYIDTLAGNKQVAIKLSDKQLLERGTTTTGNKVAENPKEELRVMNILSGAIPSATGLRTGDLSAQVRKGQKYVLTSLGEYEDATYLYTVMPFCGKGEFFDLVCHETRFSESKAKKYFYQMVLGVRYMHALGMVHLDLSLENLLMTDEDELKVCDFGVTRHLSYSNTHPPHPLPFVASTSNKPGKMGYMAPEIFSSLPFSGPLADVWSMGIVLFISLFGVPPYQIPARSDQRFALIFSGQISRLLTAWKMTEVASADAVDLIAHMLCVEERRISVDEVLSHPWLSGVSDEASGRSVSGEHEEMKETIREGKVTAHHQLSDASDTGSVSSESSGGSRMETQ